MAVHKTVNILQHSFDALQSISTEKGRSVEELVEESIQGFLARTVDSGARPQAAYTPRPQLRQKAINPKEAALLFIDVQNYNCHSSGEIAKRLCAVGCFSPLFPS